MAVVPRQRKDGTIVYWVMTSFRGQQYPERSGTDRREAERLDAKRKREKKNGTYAPAKGSGATVGNWFGSWFSSRTNRRANDTERGMFNKHVLPRTWFSRMKMGEVRPVHIQRLINEIKAESGLAPKTIHNLFANLRAGFAAAFRQGAVSDQPCVVEPGTLSKKGKSRDIYSLDEIRRAIDPELVGWRQAAWNALGFYTGMRMGEICGLKWSDWNRDSFPLSALTISKQYEGQTLKTDRPRVAPVPQELAALLTRWWDVEFEKLFLRRPRLDDPIVPYRLDPSRHVWSKTIAYKDWRLALAKADVPNRTEHSVRHSFITHARRHGGSEGDVERITHNSSGKIIDTYTHWEWQPLCESASRFPRLLVSEIDADSEGLVLMPITAPTPGLEPGKQFGQRVTTRDFSDHRGQRGTPNLPENPVGAAEPAARQFSEPLSPLLRELVAAGFTLRVIPTRGGRS